MSLDWNNPGFNSHPLSSLDRTKTVGSLFPTHALPRCKSKGHIIDEILSDAMGHPDPSGAIEFYWWPARPGTNLIWPLCQVQKLSLSLYLSLFISLTPVRKLGSAMLYTSFGKNGWCLMHDKGFCTGHPKAIIMGCQRSKTGSLYEAAIRCTGSPQTGGCITLAENVRARVTSPTSTCQNSVQLCTWKRANMLQAKYVS